MMSLENLTLQQDEIAVEKVIHIEKAAFKV